MTQPTQSADLERLRLVIEKERADPDRHEDLVWAEGWDDAMCWVLDEIHAMIGPGRRLAPDAPAPPLEGGDWGLAEDLDDGRMGEPGSVGDGAER